MAFEHEGRAEQSKAAVRRWLDAKALCQQEHWQGAMYLAGYAVECRLKAKLMEMHRVVTLSALAEKLRRRRSEVELGTHSIESLLDLTGARHRLDPEAERAFRQCNTWKVSWRYSPRAGDEMACKEFLNAVDRFSRFIQNSI